MKSKTLVNKFNMSRITLISHVNLHNFLGLLLGGNPPSSAFWLLVLERTTYLSFEGGSL